MRPRAVHEVVRGDLTNGEVVVSINSGQRALILNEIGDVVFELCDGTRTVADIAAFVREALHVSDEIDVAGDIRALVDELLRAGLVEAVE